MPSIEQLRIDNNDLINPSGTANGIRAVSHRQMNTAMIDKMQEHETLINDINDDISSVNERIDTLSGGQLNATPSSTPTTGIDIYNVKESGTYTNFGGLVVTTEDLEEGQVQLWRTDAVWSKEIIALPNDVIRTGDLTLEIVSNNIFNPDDVIENHIVDGSSGAYYGAPAGTSSSGLIPVEEGLYTVSGFGSNHYDTGYRTLNEEQDTVVSFGFLVGYGNSGGSVTIPSGAAFIQFTINTAMPGDNTDRDSVQFQKGVATAFEPFEDGIAGIDNMRLIAQFVVPAGDRTDPRAGIAISDIKTGVVLNRFDKTKVLAGYTVDGSTGAFYSAPAPWATSDVVDVTGLEYIALSGFGSIHYSLGYRFTNSSGVMIGFGFAVNQNTPDAILAVPSGATGFRMTVKTSEVGDNTDIDTIQIESGTAFSGYTPYEVGITEVVGKPIIATKALVGNTDPAAPVTNADLNKKLKGRSTVGATIIVTGDSITAMTPSYINHAAGKLGINIISNRAWGGASFTDWAYPENARQQLSTQIAQAIALGVEPDIFLVSIGTNDFDRSASWGSYDATMAKAFGALNMSIVLDAVRKNFHDIAEAFPNTRYFYGMPIQRADRELTDLNYLLDEIRKMCHRYNFTIIEATNGSGIIKDFEVDGGVGRYLYDGLHPNSDGAALMGDFYAASISKDFF